ncbi:MULTISPECIES: hypothetical protein [unclassified Nodularia (in: cyanobacteria)]|uniref:hypothetical protein n=1 Tax=unclassified Nodularia (in: cyanobacteria) TaxID=2656917 RepID=UPI0018810281|nr:MULTISPECIES: hypothetical protein [unclassified Nodularia (in: cyanobacteria)]MBE9198325.1 hypothetical protein [Nodularia sp. LEGE 06071]MCC2693069.1 hypothetical protein [Nodularia sp. LEGE 04288]
MSLTQLLNSPLWLKWTVITLLGFLLSSITGLMGGFLGLKVFVYPLAWVFKGCEGEGAIGCIILGAALGAAIGLGLTIGIAQWLILRSIVPRSQWWILTSVLGWCGIFFSLTVMVYVTTPAPGSPGFGQPLIAQLPLAGRAIAPVILAGALMGLFQWLILRSSLRQSWWWIPTHAFMMLLAGLGVYLQEENISGLPTMGVFIVIFSLIYAVLSGSLLHWLVQRK